MDTFTSLFSLEGMHFLLRWVHVFFGIIWIGHLYYFNFVQGSFFNETDAATKSNAIQKLVPRALWWFRWGALWTMTLGILLLAIKGHQMREGLVLSDYWVSILTGSAMGLMMAGNVWMVIWPAQRVVIQNAVQTASGKPAIADAAARGARAMVASRTNTLLSIPMLFFMLSASHWRFGGDLASIGTMVYFIIAGLLLLGIELNALKGKTGPMTTIKGVITCGFVLTLIFILLISFVVQPAGMTGPL